MLTTAATVAAVYVAAWLLMCGDVESNPGPPPYDDDDYYQSDQCD
jgi:hypothetical protein